MRTLNTIPTGELAKIIGREIDWVSRCLNDLWTSESLKRVDAEYSGDEKKMLRHYARQTLLGIAYSSVLLNDNEIKERITRDREWRPD